MQQLTQAIQQMISVSGAELNSFLESCTTKTVKKNEPLNSPGQVPQHILFVNKGIVRVTVTDSDAVTHTIHFALEGQFIADYASFILQQPSYYTLQAIEATEVIVIPRAAIEWGYQNLSQGDRLGRLIAEYYFIYQDNRVKNRYIQTPKQRYDAIEGIFPGIHNRVPQHMIASYLGITPVHLSRLKKAARKA